ncbi:MAG: XdhC family protein [Oscillospiraceae bacterium]|nr:XdhC family protein [Oscillospiraceae bacterium]
MDVIFDRAVTYLETGIPFAFALIVSQDGSTPRGEGSRMLITENDIVGSVGGGLGEALVIQYARTKVLNTGRAELYSIDMRQDSNVNPELICGGCCEVLIADIKGNDLLEVFQAARQVDLSSKKGWIFYLYDEDSDNPFQCCVNMGRGQVVGQFTGNAKFARDMLENPVRAAIHGDSSDGIKCVMQEINASGRVYLFGGGHVSFEIARLLVNLGFEVTVIDDREEYCNPNRFPNCATLVVDSYDNLPDLETSSNSYILIITRGHAGDKSVLRWALNKPCLYLGMIGSKPKRDALYRSLEGEGVAAEKLQSVHCPIGLSIGAETPGEIAVSIVAEMIMETKLASAPSEHLRKKLPSRGDGAGSTQSLHREKA